jgi:hypothetical protein
MFISGWWIERKEQTNENLYSVLINHKGERGTDLKVIEKGSWRRRKSKVKGKATGK